MAAPKNEAEIASTGRVKLPDGSWSAPVKRPIPERMAIPPLLGGPVKKRIRQSGKPLLNGLETEFYERLQKAGWLDIYCQAFKLRIANGTTYTVDFVCSEASGQLSAFEVKGRHAFDGALDKLKVAASLYECIHWHLVWKDADGQWQQQRVLP